jgi:protein-tyrosine-phosphatase
MTTNVLILCTHNSARSVLAEGMLNHLAKQLGKDIRAYSAGSHPTGVATSAAAKRRHCPQISRESRERHPTRSNPK